MIIQLYKNTSDRNVVSKDITLTYECEGTLKDATSITDPVITLAGINSMITDINYLYIPEFKRYYYVIDLVSVKNDLWSLSCKVDVLMSFKDTIYNQTCVVDRQEYDYNTMLSDNRLRVQANPYLITRKFPKGFTGDYNYALVLAGN